MGKRMPPGIGADLHEPLLFNPYQDAFQRARRMRFCLVCRTAGSMDEMSRFTCAKCGTVHHSNLTAPRIYSRLLVLSGRGGGKTLIGAHAAREEMMVPKSIGWVMGPTYKVLHDSTFPTLIRLIPPSWVEDWDQEHMELLLKNGAKVAFRSLEDPERARGPHGVGWGWFDEAAQCPQRAYHVFEPTLIKAGGIAICTTTVLGYDWTYEEIEQKALVDKEPGFWACRYWTDENPLFQRNPVMKAQIDRARRTMPPDFYAQEYRAERRNATGLVYGALFQPAILQGAQIKKFIPEWDAEQGIASIDPSRQIIIGLDSGSDHPFGAVMMVVTPRGIVVVSEYLERMTANSVHAENIAAKFMVARFNQVLWAGNRNEAAMRLEFALKSIGVVPAEAHHTVGIQRTQSWLYSKQFFVHKDTCPKTVAQMQAYRYAENKTPDGQKKKTEEVYKVNDELPDCIRYGLMAFPTLPSAANLPDERDQARMDGFDDKTRHELEQMRKFRKEETRGSDKTLTPLDDGYPTGEFFDDGRSSSNGHVEDFFA